MNTNTNHIREQVREDARRRFTAILGGARMMLAVGRERDPETVAYLKRKDTARILEAVKVLPAEELRALAELARLMQQHPDLVQDAIDFNAREYAEDCAIADRMMHAAGYRLDDDAELWIDAFAPVETVTTP